MYLFVRLGSTAITGLKSVVRELVAGRRVCGEISVGLEWKEALIDVNLCNRDGLRSAINVSKCGHNVTGALQVAGFVLPRSNRLAGLERFSQLLQETEHFWRWRQEKVAKIVQYGPPLI